MHQFFQLLPLSPNGPVQLRQELSQRKAGTIVSGAQALQSNQFLLYAQNFAHSRCLKQDAGANGCGQHRSRQDFCKVNAGRVEMEGADAEFVDTGGRTASPSMRMLKVFMISLPKRGVPFLTT